MTTEDFAQGVIDMLWKNHVMDVAIVHGLGYVRANRKWIEWDFRRKLKRMTPEQWETAAKDFMEYIKRCNNELQRDTSGKSGNKEEQPEDLKE